MSENDHRCGDALAVMPETVDGQPPLPVDPICRVTLDELLSDD